MEALKLVSVQDERMRRESFNLANFLSRYIHAAGLLSDRMGLAIAVDEDCGDEVFQPYYDEERHAIVISRATPVGSRAAFEIALVAHHAILARDRPLSSMEVLDTHSAEQLIGCAAAKRLVDPAFDVASIDVASFLHCWDVDDGSLRGLLDRLAELGCLDPPTVTLRLDTDAVSLPPLHAPLEHVSSGLEALRFRLCRGLIDGDLDSKVALTVTSLDSRLRKRRIGGDGGLRGGWEPPLCRMWKAPPPQSSSATSSTQREAIEQAAAVPSQALARLSATFGAGGWYHVILWWEAAVLEAEYRAMG